MKKSNTKHTSPFGKNLAAARNNAGLSQAKLAKKLGVTRAMIDYYENRAKNPSTTFVITASTKFGISADSLLGIPPAKSKPAVKKSKLDSYIEQVKKLPKAEQQYVVKFLEQVVGRNKD